MKIVLNPQYLFLQDFISQIHNNFSKSGKVVYQGRNEIRLFEENGLQINVKRYRVPNFFNRIVYSFFRPTKAQRAYEYALAVLAKGIETPVPIGYIEEKEKGLLSTSYFISLQCPYSHMMRDIERLPLNDASKEVLSAFARFTANLHQNKILHLDYSPGNILFENTTEGIRFSIVDLNRMKFETIDEDKGCGNFARLCFSESAFRFLADQYASARGFDSEICQQKVLCYFQDFRKYWDRKQKFKKLGKSFRLFFHTQKSVSLKDKN